jgi:diguanylate cyclase (GGDEF)-like protein/PAS domain S-box-containing protein
VVDIVDETEERTAERSRSFARAVLDATADRRASAEILRRRLLPASIALLVVVGALPWLAERDGLYPTGVAPALTGAFSIAGTTALILWSAGLLDRAERSRRLLEQRYQRLVEQLPLVVYLDEIDDRSTNIYTSPQIEALLGYSVEEWEGDADLFVKLLHDDDRERVLAEVTESNGIDGRFVSEYRLVARDGSAVWFRDESVPVYDEHGRAVHCQGYLLDITGRKEVEAELEHLAFHDGLTGLPNRALFVRRIEQVAASDEAAEVTVLFLDLDDFKTVNDSLGHGAGDELLVAVAERLGAAIREFDTVARFGGDEFAVLLADGPATAVAEAVARRLVRTFDEPFTVGGRELFVGASIGIAKGRDPEVLLRDADIALYTAKAAGKGHYRFFESSMRSAALDRLELTGELQRPELLDELVVHYQPMFDLESGNVEGIEALLRWQHPTRGLVAPLEFVPLAEDTGAISAIGRWVLREACAQAAQLHARFPRGRLLTVSVNVSVRQLRDPGFAHDVDTALQAASLAPHALVLEVSEAVLMDGDSDVLAALESLRGLGVRIAVDDVGTGSSPLAYLRRMQVDRLNVDRSLVRGVDGDRGDAALVEGLVGLARALGIELVAEGIERQSQLETLRRLRCGGGQGFSLARPLPLDELELLLASEAVEPGPRLRLVSGEGR